MILENIGYLLLGFLHLPVCLGGHGQPIIFIGSYVYGKVLHLTEKVQDTDVTCLSPIPGPHGDVKIVGAFLNLPFRANFYPMTGLSQRYYYDDDDDDDDDDLLTDLGEGRLGGPLERPTDP